MTTDLWSLGVTLYYCLTRQYPFEAKDESELKEKILDKNYIPNFSIIPCEYRQIISGLLCRDVNQRLSLQGILDFLKS